MRLAFSNLPVDKRFLTSSDNDSSVDPNDDPKIARQVGEEILQKRFEPGTWATAVAASGNRNEEALATYAQLRIRQLTHQRGHQNEKVECLESRRRISCLRANVAKDASRRLGSLEPARSQFPRIHMCWLGILLVSSSGAAAASGRFFGGTLPDSLDRWIPGMSLLCGIALVGVALWIRRALPRRLIKTGWITGLKLTCVITSFSSFYCGWMLLSRTPNDVIQRIVKRETQSLKVSAISEAMLLEKPTDGADNKATSRDSTFLSRSVSTDTPAAGRADVDSNDD